MTSFDSVIFLLKSRCISFLVGLFTIYLFFQLSSSFTILFLCMSGAYTIYLRNCVYVLCVSALSIFLFFPSIRLHLFYYHHFLLILSTSFEISVFEFLRSVEV